MIPTIAHLVHRVPDDLRALGRDSVEAAPAFLRSQDVRADASPHDAAWRLVEREDGDRHTMVPVPIAVAVARGDRGVLRALLGIDIDGALALAWREGTRTRIVRAAAGGLTDPVVDELDDLLERSGPLRCEGPLPGSLDAIRRIRAGLVPEIEHRPVDTARATEDRPLPHPWLDDVFAALAAHHGAHPRDVMRPAARRGETPSWIWTGARNEAAPGPPAAGVITGLPATMPPFHLQNRDDGDVLKIGAGPGTYRRRGRQRFLAIARDAFPDTVWATIAPGIPAATVMDLPGLEAYRVGRIEEGGTTLLHLERDA